MKELVAIALSFILGMASTKITDFFKYRKEALDCLYSPIVKIIMKNTHGAFLFSDIDKVIQQKIIDTIVDNYALSDKEFQTIFYGFYSALQYENEASEEKDQDSPSNKYFFELYSYAYEKVTSYNSLLPSLRKRKK